MLFNKDRLLCRPVDPSAVRSCRNKLDLTQSQMADVFGVSIDMWQRKEMEHDLKSSSPCSIAEYNLVLLMANEHPFLTLRSKTDNSQFCFVNEEPAKPLIKSMVLNIRNYLGLNQSEFWELFGLSLKNGQKKESSAKTQVSCYFAEYNLIMLMANEHPFIELITK